MIKKFTVTTIFTFADDPTQELHQTSKSGITKSQAKNQVQASKEYYATRKNKNLISIEVTED